MQCGNAKEKWNQLSRRDLRQLAEACHGRSLATASRPRPIKLQHSFLGLCLAPAFRVQGCVLCARRRTLMHTTNAFRQLIENREPPAKTGIGYAQIQTIGYTRDVKTEATGQQPAAQRRLAPRGKSSCASCVCTHPSALRPQSRLPPSLRPVTVRLSRATQAGRTTSARCRRARRPTGWRTPRPSALPGCSAPSSAPNPSDRAIGTRRDRL